MNQIKSKPNVYDFEDDFNYGAWTAGTVLTLANVPWNSDYRDIVRFTNQAALDTYLNGVPNLILQYTMISKFQRNVRISTPVNAAMKYNYIRAFNPATPIRGDIVRTYYYFIQDVIYVAPNTTELVLQLDVWQTFGYDVTFGSCYVERGHAGVANTNGFNNYGRDYLTIPEGLDVGGEYRTIHVDTQAVITPAIEDGYSILVCSSVDMTVAGGTDSAPALVAAPGGIFQTLPSGATFYIFKNGNDFNNFMIAIQSDPWISQGILSVTVIPSYTRSGMTLGSNVSPYTGAPFYIAPSQPANIINHTMKTAWRDMAAITDILGTTYSGLKKFWTYPYMVIELTTFTGSPAIIKPEMWQNADAVVREMASFMPPGQRLVFYPLRYNGDSETTGSAESGSEYNADDDLGEFLDLSVVMGDFPTLPLVNDMAISYLASNKNGLAYQFSSADWAQQKALAGASATANIANANIGNTAKQAGISNSATNAMAQLAASMDVSQSVVGGIGDVAGGVERAQSPVGLAAGAAGGAARGAIGVAGASMSASQALRNANISTNARTGSANSSVNAAVSVADTNVGLAEFSARGDYANAIAGVNAKIQDARMTQPSVSGQYGGDAFNLINGIAGVSIRFKMMNLSAIRAIGDFWLRYGYAVNHYVGIPTNFMVMTHFTYWKLQETYISQAPIPEKFKQTIRGIFEKGVTVWADPTYIGTISWANNVPVGGFSF